VVEGNSYRNVVVVMEEENDKYVGRSCGGGKQL